MAGLSVFDAGGISLFGLYWKGVTLDAAVAKGTWTASGTWTIPAVTLGGAVAGGDKAFTNVGDMTFATGSILASGSTNGNTLLLRANDTTFLTLTTGATDTLDIGAHTISGAVAVTDDIIFALGTSSDGALMLKAGTNNANTAITGVLIGTPITQATAADSVFLSNITASGDIGIYVNKAGNSLEVLWADASAGTLTIGHGLSGLTIKTNSGDITIAAGGNLINLNQDVAMLSGKDIYFVDGGSWLYTNQNATTGLNKTTLKLGGATSGIVTVTGAAVAGTWTMTLPTAVAGTGGFQLTDANADGICTWAGAGSLREYKDIIGLATSQDALDTILGTGVYRFHYKEGMGTQDSKTEYVGILGEEAPWAMHYGGRVVNPVNTLGYMVLGVQALHTRIKQLEEEVTELRRIQNGTG